MRTLILATLLLTPTALSAQLPFSIVVEGRAGYAMPTGDFADADQAFAAEGGPDLALAARIEPAETFGIFAGYRQSRFGCDRCGLFDLEETVTLEGLEAGVQLSFPVAVSGLRPWVRGAIVRQTLGFSDGDESLETEAETGFGGAIGVTRSLGNGFEIAPALRYWSVPAEFSFPSAGLPDREFDVSAVSLDVSLAFRI